jgi:hypothetical protein
MKLNRLGDYFNFGFHKDVEEDYSLCIMLFGRDFVWRFFKKDTEWATEDYDYEELDQA